MKDIFYYVTSNINAYQHPLRGTLVLLFFIATLMALLLSSSCRQQRQHTDAQATTDSTTTYYTCSMHTDVHLPHPGKCPICGMTLIAVHKSAQPKADEIVLTDQQIQLGNISVDTITKSRLGDEVVLTGTINFNQQKSTTVSSRVIGRIEHLYFKNVGDYVRKGDKLFDIYSEDLNNAKQEYLLAVERQKVLDNSVIDFNQLIQSARNKLKLWGLTDAQIAELSKSKTTSPTTTFYSNEAGYITSLDIREGDYAIEGGTIVHLADLSSLWVEAQVYTSELPKIDKNGSVLVQVPDLPGKQIAGKVEFVNPEINPDTRITLVRVIVANPGNELKPGMPAYVHIKSNRRSALTLPVDAVIRDAQGATVWIKTGDNTFKSKMVDLGLESDDRIEITNGLNSGDVVVVTGAYLVNSEYVFKKGANPMTGHDMKNMQMN
jgi:Cu(I)/Ag(I) efflux system membrane fusion protein